MRDARAHYEHRMQALLEEFARVYPDLRSEFVERATQLAEDYIKNTDAENGFR